MHVESKYRRNTNAHFKLVNLSIIRISLQKSVKIVNADFSAMSTYVHFCGILCYSWIHKEEKKNGKTKWKQNYSFDKHQVENT